MSKYFDGLTRVFDQVEATLATRRRVSVDHALDLTVKMIRSIGKRHKVILVGNGGSAAIASHLAVDFWKNGGVRATAFNDASLLTCISNDFGYEHVFEKPIEAFADPGDVLIAISSSGRSESILRAVKAARERRVEVVTMSGFKRDNPLRSKGGVNFYVPADDYGPVEITHLALGHALADAAAAKNR